jgi:hypothetical protein
MQQLGNSGKEKMLIESKANYSAVNTKLPPIPKPFLNYISLINYLLLLR